MVDQITVYITVWCPDCKRAKKFLAEHRVESQRLYAKRDCIEAIVTNTRAEWVGCEAIQRHMSIGDTRDFSL